MAVFELTLLTLHSQGQAMHSLVWFQLVVE